MSAGVPPTERASNRLRDTLDAGGVATLLASAAMSSDLVDLLGQTRAAGVWLEGEHGPLTWERLGDLSRAAELWGLAAVVRIPAYEPWRVARALTLGAHGVVLPQVSGPEEAAAFASAARFSPLGTRGVTRGRRSYGRDDYFALEAASPVTVVQVESIDVVDRLDELCEVPGLDVVFIAPNDLADSMGLIGQPSHPDVTAVLDAGIARIAAAGKLAGTSAAPDRVDHLVSLGARLLYMAIDAWIVAEAERVVPR